MASRHSSLLPSARRLCHGLETLDADFASSLTFGQLSLAFRTIFHVKPSQIFSYFLSTFRSCFLKSFWFITQPLSIMLTPFNKHFLSNMKMILDNLIPPPALDSGVRFVYFRIYSWDVHRWAYSTNGPKIPFPYCHNSQNSVEISQHGSRTAYW